MTRSEGKATAEVCARHVHKQLERLIRFEWNPAKVRSGVRLLAGELHRTCVQFTWRDSDDAICLFLVPLFDAQVLLGEALAFEVLDRDRVTQAMASLQRVCDHIQTN